MGKVVFSKLNPTLDSWSETVANLTTEINNIDIFNDEDRVKIFSKLEYIRRMLNRKAREIRKADREIKKMAWTENISNAEN